MEIIYVLLPLSLILAGLGLFGYIWSVKRGQFDDLETPARKVLIDEDELK